MKASRFQKIEKEIGRVKEELFNSIARHFGIDVPVQLSSREIIFMGAQGSFEGNIIRINKNLPLFWQLLILEHEIGHVVFSHGANKHGKVLHNFQVNRFSSEEQRAWEWVEENPIAPGTFVDRAIRKYISELKKIGKAYGHVDEVMRVGWWY